MSELAKKDCVPCKGGVPALTREQYAPLLQQLPNWSVERDHHLTRTYTFPDFAKALVFVNRVGEMAEKQGHHPDIYLTWGKVRLDIWTHKIDGLTESDFVFAAKADKCL
ncbi:MAG: 4a-hydroxytetrahydrobiopterin dehydratase [Phycisphaerales bacterium]|nr:4a-hydroxytetrahydrobiopterin dehydratase [Phycisphaerales bacterium]